MGSGIYDCYFHHDPAEVSKCMLCYDPECAKACPQSADIGGKVLDAEAVIDSPHQILVSN